MTSFKSVNLPDFGTPVIRPAIPGEVLAARCDAAYARAGKKWLYVYADREHNTNLLHLTSFEPRFEEAVLLLGPNGLRIMYVGNDCVGYTAISPLPGLETVLAQCLSTLGQDRTQAPSFDALLKDAGIASGDSIGIVGWKYLEPVEWAEDVPAFLIPYYMVNMLARLVGGMDGLSDETAIFMNPRDGLRTIIDADQIAAFEWASARASASVWSVLRGARPGQREIEAAVNLNYAGEPLSAHIMFSCGNAARPINGLNSPAGHLLAKGDAITVGVGYWGGLSSRAGLLDDDNDGFVKLAARYFEVLVAWYDTVDLGVAGGAVHDTTVEKMAQGGWGVPLSTGHLVNYEEWLHTPMRPGSTDQLRSGMMLQVDTGPSPMPAGTALNCEDTIALADPPLRAEIAAKHPEVWARIEARRAFMRDELGVTLKDCILPLSNIQLYLPPLWLAPNKVFVNE